MNFKDATDAIFAQMHQQICEFTPEQYAQKLDILSGFSVGQHFRHIIEFFECLFSQMEEGTICYDRRKRNLAIETSPQTAALLIENFRSLMGNIDENKKLTLLFSVATEGNENFVEVPTNLAREISYNIEHAIHHLAIIKIGIKQNFPFALIDETLGIAPATIRYTKSVVKS